MSSEPGDIVSFQNVINYYIIGEGSKLSPEIKTFSQTQHREIINQTKNLSLFPLA